MIVTMLYVATMLLAAQAAVAARSLAHDEPSSPGKDLVTGSVIRDEATGELAFAKGSAQGAGRRSLRSHTTSCRRMEPHPPTHAARPGIPLLPPPPPAGALAQGAYIDSAHTASNFGKLRIRTASGASDIDQARAAGFLEGYLTAARMNDHW